MKRGLSILFVSALILVLVCSPVAGQTVNVFPVDVYEKQMEAGESVTYQWVIYNNDTSQVLVEAELDRSSGDGWSAHLDQNFTVIEPEKSAVITLVVQSSRSSITQWVNLTITMIISDMSDPDITTTSQDEASTHILSLFGTSAGWNRIMGIFPNSLPAPFNTNIWSFIITVIIWMGIAGIVYFVVDPLIRQLTKRTKNSLDDIVLKVIRTPLFVLIVLFGFTSSLVIINIPTDLHIAIMEIYRVGIIVVGAWLAFRIYDKVVIHYAEQWAKRSETELDDVLVPLLHKLGLIIIPSAAIVLVVNALGYDVTVLVAGMGVLGIVIAFAAQETMSNFFAGVQLLADRPFRVGDWITLETGEICEVKKIGIRSTTLYDIDRKQTIVLPNNDIANKRVTNQSLPNGRRGIILEVGVAYGSDVDKVKSILREAIQAHPNVVKGEGENPILRFSNFGQSSLDFKAFVTIDSIKNQWKAASDIREAINKRFAEEGIEIPFPQRVVYYKNADPGFRSG